MFGRPARANHSNSGSMKGSRSSSSLPSIGRGGGGEKNGRISPTATRHHPVGDRGGRDVGYHSIGRVGPSDAERLLPIIDSLSSPPPQRNRGEGRDVSAGPTVQASSQGSVGSANGRLTNSSSAPLLPSYPHQAPLSSSYRHPGSMPYGVEGAYDYAAIYHHAASISPSSDSLYSGVGARATPSWPQRGGGTGVPPEAYGYLRYKDAAVPMDGNFQGQVHGTSQTLHSHGGHAQYHQELPGNYYTHSLPPGMMLVPPPSSSAPGLGMWPGRGQSSPGPVVSPVGRQQQAGNGEPFPTSPMTHSQRVMALANEALQQGRFSGGQDQTFTQPLYLPPRTPESLRYGMPSNLAYSYAANGLGRGFQMVPVPIGYTIAVSPPRATSPGDEAGSPSENRNASLKSPSQEIQAPISLEQGTQEPGPSEGSRGASTMGGDSTQRSVGRTPRVPSSDANRKFHVAAASSPSMEPVGHTQASTESPAAPSGSSNIHDAEPQSDPRQQRFTVSQGMMQPRESDTGSAVEGIVQMAMSAMREAQSRGEPPLPDPEALHAAATHAIKVREMHMSRIKALGTRFAAAQTAYYMSTKLPRHRREAERTLRSLKLEILLEVDLLRGSASNAIESIRNWQRSMVVSGHFLEAPPFSYLIYPDYVARMSNDIAALCKLAGIPLQSWCGIDPRNNPLLLGGVTLQDDQEGSPEFSEQSVYEQPSLSSPAGEAQDRMEVASPPATAQSRSPAFARDLAPQQSVLLEDNRSQISEGSRIDAPTSQNSGAMPIIANNALPQMPGYSVVPLLMPAGGGFFGFPFFGMAAPMYPGLYGHAQLPAAPAPAPAPAQPVPPPEPETVADSARAPSAKSVRFDPDAAVEPAKAEPESLDPDAGFAIQRIYRGHRARLRTLAGKRITQLISQCKKLCGALKAERLESLMEVYGRGMHLLAGQVTRHSGLDATTAAVARPLSMLVRAAIALLCPFAEAPTSLPMAPTDLHAIGSAKDGAWFADRLQSMSGDVLERLRGVLLPSSCEALATAALSDASLVRSNLFAAIQSARFSPGDGDQDDDDQEAAGDEEDPDPDVWWRYNGKRVGDNAGRPPSAASSTSREYSSLDCRTAVALLAWCNCVVKIAELSPTWFMDAVNRVPALQAQTKLFQDWEARDARDKVGLSLLRSAVTDSLLKAESGLFGVAPQEIRKPFSAAIIAIGPDVDLPCARTAASRLISALGMQGVLLPTWRTLSYVAPEDREDDEDDTPQGDPTSLKQDYARQLYSVIVAGGVPIVRVSHYMQIATAIRMIAERRKWHVFRQVDSPGITDSDPIDYTVVWMRMSDDAHGPPPPTDKEAATFLVRMKKSLAATVKMAPARARLLQLTLNPATHGPNPGLGIAVFELDEEGRSSVAQEDDQDPVALAKRARRRDERLITEFDDVCEKLYEKTEAQGRRVVFTTLLSDTWVNKAWVGAPDAYLPRMSVPSAGDAAGLALLAIARADASCHALITSLGKQTLALSDTQDSSVKPGRVSSDCFEIALVPRRFYLRVSEAASDRKSPAPLSVGYSWPRFVLLAAVEIPDVQKQWAKRLPLHDIPESEDTEWNPTWQDLLPEVAILGSTASQFPASLKDRLFSGAKDAALPFDLGRSLIQQCVLQSTEHGAWHIRIETGSSALPSSLTAR